MVQANEIMKKQVLKVKETATVRSVIEIFIEHGISGVPVVNNSNQIVAYISDGDIMRFIGKQKNYVYDMISFVSVLVGDEGKLEERAKAALDLNVLKIATKKVIKVSWDEEIENIAALLGEKQIKKLPVERSGELVGIISRGDVIRQVFRSLL